MGVTGSPRGERAAEELDFFANDQHWLLSWHPGQLPPTGTPHGSAGICLTADHQAVLVSRDGLHWDFPAGRPEGAETWEETLHREMLEEACVSVRRADLLGFSRGRCVEGTEQGLVLVRAVWRAEVSLLPWSSAFEIRERRLVPAGELFEELSEVGTRLPLPLYRRALPVAGVPLPA